MRKLFGPSKSKNKPSKDFGAEDVAPVPTPIHAHHAKFLSKPSPQQRQKQTESQPAAQVAVHGQPSAGIGEPGWENIPTPGHTPGPGPPPLMGGGVSRSSSYHSIPSPNLNPNYNGRPPSPSLTNTSFSRQAAGYSPNPNDYAGRPVPTKKTSATAPVALGILAALDPHASPALPSNTQQTVSKSHSEERFYSSSENGHPQQQQVYPGQGGAVAGGHVVPQPERKEKRGFWSSSRDRDRDRRDQQPYEFSQQQTQSRAQGDVPRHSAESERTLTSMIGYLAATNSEDWSVVLEVCDRASLNETNAKEAVKALRSEFKYGQPHAQLAAAKLWAIMLRNSTDIFISQSRQRKFLDTLEELIKSGRSTPVVTDRLLEIIAAAAYASGRHKKGSEKDGFRGLWLRVKPADKPDEGIPFDSEDAMFSPPSARASTYEHGAGVPAVELQQASPLPAENLAPVRHKPAGTRNRIIPLDEDIRRLFQECKMAVGNATLLSEALLTCTPSSLKNNAIIKEFHKKCENSQKLIFAQIEWATAQAEHSRVRRNAEKERSADDSEGREAKDKEREIRKKRKDGDDETIEEKLLGALLGANEELLSALRQYDDLAQILVEKKSRKEVRMDRRELAQHHQQQQMDHLGVAQGVGASRSRSPSPARSVSGSPPSNGSAPSHGGHGSNVGHAHSHSYQGTMGVGGVYTAHQGSYTSIHQPEAQQHAQQGAVYASAPQAQYTDQSHGHTHANNYRSPPEHDASSLAPPPKAPYGPRSPGNVSLRSRTPSPHGYNRPDEYNNTQHPSVAGDHQGGAGAIVLTHNEGYGGSYDDHAHIGQQHAQYGSYQDSTRYGVAGYQDDNASSIYYPQGGQEYRGQQEYQSFQHDTTLQYGVGQGQDEEVEYDADGVPIRPSAKALGKRKAQEPVEEEHNPRASITSEDLYLSQQGILSLERNSDTDTDSISSANARHNDGGGGGINLNGSGGGAGHGGKAWMSPPTQYVYDAAAERTKQRLEEAQKAVAAANAAHDARPLVNGVH